MNKLEVTVRSLAPGKPENYSLNKTWGQATF